MKKIINISGIPGLILMATLVFMPVSCNKDAVKDNPLPGSSSQLIKVSGEDVSVATKTTLNGLVTSWKADDKVGIYSPDARTALGGGTAIANVEFHAASSGVSSNFTGTMYWGAANTPHIFYAYYPYSIGYSGASNVVPITLATAQTQLEAGSNAHISALDFMVATPVTVTSPGSAAVIENTQVSLRYNHVFTVLEFQIKGTGQLKAVKLSANSTLVFSGGTIDITQATPATDAAYTFASQTGTSGEVTTTLTTAATLTATNTKVYMVINPGIPTGNCLISLLTDGTTWKYINKAAPAGGFKRGVKYVVTVDGATATDAIVDVEGNTYATVTIGTQIWMASNLKTTKYNDGSDIPNVKDNNTWYSATAGAWCDYNNTSSNSTTYGKLYNWYAVDNNDTKVASNGGKNICPVGWHVPTDAEWTTLTDYLGGLSVAGDKLKESGTTHWISNTAATNSSGFTALPGGYCNYDGYSFNSIGYYGRWWSSSPDGGYADFRQMASSQSSVSPSPGIRTFGFSVRCVKGETVSDNNGNVYSTVVTSTGKTWLDRNLGATQVATSSTDEAAYGDLYQWGRGPDGHQFRTSLTTTTLSSSDVPVSPDNAKFILAPNTPYDWRSGQNGGLWQGVTGTNNPCPSGFRLPTDAELDAERASWSSKNAAGAFDSPLKLPVAGFRNSGGSLNNVGSDGSCWSSTVTEGGTTSRRLNFSSSDANVYGNSRALGYSVRCIKE